MPTRGTDAAPCTWRARTDVGTHLLQIGALPRLGEHHGGDDLTTLGVGHADDERGEAAGRIAECGFDLARRHVGAGGLDHVAATTQEVEEAVVVDPEEVTRPVPLVGGEHLEPLTSVVPLHERRSPEPELPHRPRGHVGQGLGVDHSGREPGHRTAERTAVTLRLVALVGAHETHAAGLGHPQHVVTELGVDRTQAVREQGMEVAATNGGEVPAGEAGVRHQPCDRRHEPVGELGPLAFDEVERCRGVETGGTEERGPGDEDTEDVVGEATDPEHRRVGEQPHAGVESAQLVERREVADERAVLVDHALRCAGGPRRVHDDHAVVGRDVVLHRVEQGVGHLGGESLQLVEAVEPRVTQERCCGRTGSVRREPDRGLERGDVVIAAMFGHPEQHVDVGAGEEVAQLGRGGEGTDRDGDRADAHRGQPGDDEGRARGEEQADAASPPGARREQPARQRPTAAFGVGVGEPIVVAHDVVAVGVRGDPVPQHTPDRRPAHVTSLTWMRWRR